MDWFAAIVIFFIFVGLPAIFIGYIFVAGVASVGVEGKKYLLRDKAVVAIEEIALTDPMFSSQYLDTTVKWMWEPCRKLWHQHVPNRI